MRGAALQFRLLRCGVVSDRPLHLALRLNLYRSATLEVPVELVQAAEDLGYHSVWTAEAYGTDALSPLAYLAALTRRIKLGTAIAQLAARPPATLAMHAMTIDALAGGGRVIIGIGVSGPQIVEGWYGQPWGSPTDRLRDYVAIVRKVLDREAPVTHDGPEISLPYRGPGRSARARPLRRSCTRGPHPDLDRVGRAPQHRAVRGGRRRLVADGPRRRRLGTWSRSSGAGHGGASRPDGFEVFTGCSVQLTDDVAGALDRMRPLTAMYVGGMGSATHNFHRDAMARRGFPEVARRIQELWLAGRKEEAIAAVPDEYLEQSRSSATSSASAGGGRRGRRRQGVTGLIVDAPGPSRAPPDRRAAGTEYMTLRDDRRRHAGRAPAPHHARTGPEKRNAISTPMRVELLDALRAHDNDPDVRVTIIRGAGPCFSAGYDLGGAPLMEDAPFYSAPGDGQWARQANDTWFSIWDLAKPVIAQIHGYAIAGAHRAGVGLRPRLRRRRRPDQLPGRARR